RELACRLKSEVVSKLGELLPARVGLRFLVRVRFGVQVATAERAETGTVLAAENLVRERQGNGIPRPRREIELVVLHVRGRQLVRLARARGLVFPRTDLHEKSRVAQAAHARSDEPRGEFELEHQPRAPARELQRGFR